LNELSNTDPGSGGGSQQSHARLQQPVAFKQNDDHQRTLRRELVGDGIESGGDDDKRLVLFFYNYEPGLLPAVA